MTRSFLRVGLLRVMTTGLAVCLSAISIDSLAASDGTNTAESGIKANGRAAHREGEPDERGEYPGLTTVKTGSSTKAIRKQAVSDLHLERLVPAAQQKAVAVVDNLGLYRRLPTISFECDPEVYSYFLKNPDVAVSTWRAMEISQFQLNESGPNQYRADAGDGSVGNVELLLQTHNETLILCDGAFKSPLLPKPIVARSLMRLQSSFTKEADGRIIGTHNGDVFVEFPSHAVEAVAKVISPVSHSIADRNFKQMTLFVHLMSQAMAKRPDWIEFVGSKLEGITAQKQLEFLEVGAKSYVDARKRTAIANGTTFSPEDVLTPFRQWNSDGTISGTPQSSQKAENPKVVQTANQSGNSTPPK